MCVTQISFAACVIVAIFPDLMWSFEAGHRKKLYSCQFDLQTIDYG